MSLTANFERYSLSKISRSSRYLNILIALSKLCLICSEIICCFSILVDFSGKDDKESPFFLKIISQYLAKMAGAIEELRYFILLSL